MDEYSILPDWKFREESLEEFYGRYTGFGKDLYIILRERVPYIFDKLRFYQSKELQTEDSFAACFNGIFSFGIQLDPLIEVIVIWNKDKHIEVTSYAENEYEVAVDLIKTKFCNDRR